MSDPDAFGGFIRAETPPADQARDCPDCGRGMLLLCSYQMDGTGVTRAEIGACCPPCMREHGMIE